MGIALERTVLMLHDPYFFVGFFVALSLACGTAIVVVWAK